MIWLKRCFQWLLAVSLVGAGVNHFVNWDYCLRIMPDSIPWHETLVAVSGVIEVFLGVLLVVPPWTRLAAWGTIALLVAVFPANVNMAMHPERYPEFPQWVLYVRLPFQGVLIAWAFWFTRRSAAE